MTKPKLIVLNGFAAAGKTTIANMYITEHDMAMALEADALVDAIGNWVNHREDVRQITFELTKSILRTYLSSGHDVILPYLVNDAREVEEFEAIAHSCSADYYEVLLYNEPAEAISRLLKRGKWGQETSPPITTKDLPDIKEVMAKMETAFKKRPDTIIIELKGSNPDATYAQLLKLTASPPK